MESKPPQKPPRKYKFKPKAQPRPAALPEVKAEKVEDVDATKALELMMRQIHERSLKREAKGEKKVHGSQIAFGMGADGPSMKSYGPPRGKRAGGGACSSGLNDTEYEEPWDYYSNYPTTVPLRRPYSGDPAILDEDEFGEAAQNEVYDENLTTPAVDLGLLEESVEPTMFFLQFPPLMPTPKRSASASAPDAKEDTKPKGNASSIDKMARLGELPAGYMGKMLVYKSGAVKLKLGETLYDVSPGMDYVFAQDVVAVNTAEKRYCVIGEVEKGAQVALDVVGNLPNF